MREVELLEIVANKRILIYGAGMVGGLVFKRLRTNGIAMENIAFAVSQAVVGQRYMDCPVFDIHGVNVTADLIIIVATLEKNQLQIIKTLWNLGIEKYYIVDSQLYREMEHRYVETYLNSHVLPKKERDILYVSSDNNSSSGAFLCLVDLNKELNKRGISTLVILPMYGNGEELLIENQIEYTYVLSEDWLGEIEKTKKDLADNDKAIQTLVSFIHDYRMKLVHINTTYSYVGAMAAKEAKVPYLWHIREFIKEQGYWFLDEEKAYQCINEASKIIPVSKYVASCYAGFDQEKVRVVYDGVDIDRYFSKRDILQSNRMKILMPGNIIPLKGQKQLVEAALILQQTGLDFEISFLGSGDADYIAVLNEMVNKHNLSDKVFFYDRTNAVEVWYQKSDVVVVCSRSEAFGRVTIEAQLAGCLIIGAKCGATKELIEDGRTGVFYELDSSADLAKRIVWAWKHPIEARKIACEAQEKAKQDFSKEKNAENIVAIYTELLGSDKDGESERSH